MSTVIVEKIESNDLNRIISRSLPDQGCIEIQRDVPGKEHVWHQHNTDETIVVMDGQLRFYWEEGNRICGPGDMIALPAGTRHGSVAQEAGATYLIAFHRVSL